MLPASQGLCLGVYGAELAVSHIRYMCCALCLLNRINNMFSLVLCHYCLRFHINCYFCTKLFWCRFTSSFGIHYKLWKKNPKDVQSSNCQSFQQQIN